MYILVLKEVVATVLTIHNDKTCIVFEVFSVVCWWSFFHLQAVSSEALHKRGQKAEAQSRRRGKLFVFVMRLLTRITAHFYPMILGTYNQTVCVYLCSQISWSKLLTTWMRPCSLSKVVLPWRKIHTFQRLPTLCLQKQWNCSSTITFIITVCTIDNFHWSNKQTFIYLYASFLQVCTET